MAWDSCTSRDGEQWPDSAYIFKIEPEEFTDRLKGRLQNFCLEQLEKSLFSPEEKDLVLVFIVGFLALSTVLGEFQAFNKN